MTEPGPSAQNPTEDVEVEIADTNIVVEEGSVSDEGSDFDDVELGRKGMVMILANDWKSAEELFTKYK